MERRSTPQRKIDENAFPVRLSFYVPPSGLGRMSDHLFLWLEKEVGRGNYARHSMPRDAKGDRFAIYLRRPMEAAELVAAFPDLVMADGTLLPGYYSPNAPIGNAEEDDPEVCNLYEQSMSQAALREFFHGDVWIDRVGNLQPGKIYPDQQAPIIRHAQEGLELVMARWGMPTPSAFLSTERDPGVTNVRNVRSGHWRRWLGPRNRCLVPVTAFAEPKGGGVQWFELCDPSRPAFFAGIETRGWRSTRKVKDGQTVDDLFAFLTCRANAEVGEVHPKAMPVILTHPEECERWLSLPFELCADLQRPLPDGSLELVAAR